MTTAKLFCHLQCLVEVGGGAGAEAAVVGHLARANQLPSVAWLDSARASHARDAQSDLPHSIGSRKHSKMHGMTCSRAAVSGSARWKPTTVAARRRKPSSPCGSMPLRMQQRVS